VKGLIDIQKIPADFIFVSHGHEDHIADAVYLASRTQATIVSNFEICNWLNGQGVAKCHPMNTGGKWNFGKFSVKCTVAQHSSALPDGNYGGNPMGFIVEGGGETFYYSGDTALTMDMQLIRSWAKLNFAVLPIGDNFTMGPEDAATCAKMIVSPTVVGVHYDTFGLIKIDHSQALEVFKNSGIQLLLPKIGETYSL
jgi:L-ascorbate metabolism protein UlaG (beta-lactamase superfamily)